MGIPKVRRGVIAATLVAASVVGLTGCGDVDTGYFAASDVIGTWVGPDGATVILTPDGSVTYSSVPMSALTLGYRDGPPVSGRGSWRIDNVEGGRLLWLSLSHSVMPRSMGLKSAAARVMGGDDPAISFRIVGLDSFAPYRMHHPAR